ncbi:glutamate--tRNA ligase [Gammaproteobacteria bacterium AH-315-M22]|nr:glutamate--tRNA ligase [Gammaproteobacteria bacterium AH-315-M22]
MSVTNTNAKVITRFAPSPTGFVHLGNIRTALFNVLLARKHGGDFLLRIEDTDAERSKNKFTAALMQDMRWLGLTWAQGPIDDSGKPGAYHQSQRQHLYQTHYDTLQDCGKAYPCFCSTQRLAVLRKTQLSAGQPPRYDGICAHLNKDEVESKLAEGQKPTLRFRVPQSETITFVDLVRGEQRFASDDIGDFIIRRGDGTPAFFFTNAIDDALMNVTHILRGDDHLTNTPRQLMLLQALAMREPAYGHISLIIGDDGVPLSKRNGSMGIRDMRAAGYLPEAIVNYLSRLGHYYADNSFMSLDNLAKQFDASHLGKAPAHFDLIQLQHWQKEALNAADDDTVWQWLGAAVQQNVPADKKDLFLKAVKPNINNPHEGLAWVKVFFSDDLNIEDDAQHVIDEAGKAFFDIAAQVFTDEADFKTAIKAIGKQTGKKGKQLFWPVRAALTGKVHGPEMSDLALLLGVDEIVARCKRAV